MYAYYFVHLRGVPEDWATWLAADGARMWSTVDPGVRSVGPDEAVRIVLLPARPVGSGFAIPFKWEVPGLFRALGGDLGLQPIESGTQLNLSGSYRPDRSGDPAETHRLVEAYLKRSLDALASTSI